MDVTGRPLIFGCLLKELYKTSGEHYTDGESFLSMAETVKAVRGPVQKCLMLKEIQIDGWDEQPQRRRLVWLFLSLSWSRCYDGTNNARADSWWQLWRSKSDTVCGAASMTPRSDVVVSGNVDNVSEFQIVTEIRGFHRLRRIYLSLQYWRGCSSTHPSIFGT